MNEKAHQSFTELIVWQKAREFKTAMKQLADGFPSVEKFRLCDQLIRSSRSIAATIAEGHGRFTYKDRLHFCIMARGSLSETYNHLIDAFDCNYIAQAAFDSYKGKIQEIERILNGYIAYLRKNL
jgi:four helix bundle protein